MRPRVRIPSSPPQERPQGSSETLGVLFIPLSQRVHQHRCAVGWQGNAAHRHIADPPTCRNLPVLWNESPAHTRGLLVGAAQRHRARPIRGIDEHQAVAAAASTDHPTHGAAMFGGTPPDGLPLGMPYSGNHSGAMSGNACSLLARFFRACYNDPATAFCGLRITQLGLPKPR